ETLRMRLGTSLYYSYYGNRSLQPAEQGYPGAYFLASYKQPRTEYTLNMRYQRENAVTSEVATTGVVLPLQAIRDTWTIAPAMSWSATERLSFSLSYALTDASFRDDPQPGLFNYTNQSLSAGTSYLFSARDSVSVSATANRYETDPRTRQSDTAS